MDEHSLEMLGLTRGEAKAYIALLRLGQTSTGPIARQSGVSTSKLYVILDRLEKKGLVSHVELRGVRRYQAVEPAKIRDYVRQRKDEVEALERRLESIIPDLEREYRRQRNEAPQNISVFQGFKGLMTAHEHMYLKLREGDEYVVLGIPQVEAWDRYGFFEKDHLRRAKAGISCRLLFNEGVDREILSDRNRHRLCEARFMPSAIRTPAYFTVFADTTLVVIPTVETITIEIVNREAADAFRAYFEEFWGKSKPFR